MTKRAYLLSLTQLDALRDTVDRGEVDVVLAYDTDRLSRDPDHLSYLAKYFLDAGVQLEFVRMPTENTDEGRLLMYVQGYSSKKEITKFVDRSRRGKRAKAQKPDHNYAGGYVPFGYTTEKYLDGDRFKHRIIIDAVQAEIVKEVFSLYNGGMTSSQIARSLYERHVPTKCKGGTWTGSLVWRMLRNPVYIGKGTYADVVSLRPAIVDEVTFTQAQLRLNKNTHRAGRPANVMYILKGLGKCHCGGTLSMRGVKGYRYAYCSRQNATPYKYNCFTGKKHFHLTPIEDFVWGEVVDFMTEFRKGDLAGILYDNYESNIEHRDQLVHEAKVQLEEINKQKSKLLSEFVEGRFDSDMIDLKLSKLKDEQEHWQSIIDEQALLSDARIDDLVESLRQLDDLYDWGLMTATPEQKKEIISRVLHEFILYPDRIELRYKLPVTELQIAECVQVSTFLLTNFSPL